MVRLGLLDASDDDEEFTTARSPYAAPTEADDSEDEQPHAAADRTPRRSFSPGGLFSRSDGSGRAAPPFAPTSRDAAVHASTVDLLRNRGLSRSESALALLGAEGVASLVQLVGRQSSSALTLNVFSDTTEQPWEADAALLTDAELAALVAMAGAADDADVCLQHGCDADEALIAQKEAAEVAPELY